MGKSQRRRIWIVWLTIVLTASHVWGTVFQLGGPVNSVEDRGDLTDINVGDRWVFEYEFDTDAPPTSVSPIKAIYPMGPSSITVGSGSGSFPPSSDALYVYNDSIYGSGDGFFIGARGGDWPGFQRIGVELALVDSDGTLFSDLESPDAPLNLADLESTSFRLSIVGQNSTDRAYVLGVVDTFVELPEPSAGAMLAAALATLLCSRSHRAALGIRRRDAVSAECIPSSHREVDSIMGA